MAWNAAMAKLQRIEARMTIYRPGSQLSILNRTGRVENPDPAVCEIFELARKHSELSNGAFDVTVQPLWDLHFRCIKRDGRIPTPAEVKAARARVGYENISITPDRIAFARTGMSATLNGIAQGYATDCVMAVLKAHGIEHALVDAGELAPCGTAEPESPWDAGIQNPRDRERLLGSIAMDGRCLATSGDYATCFTPDYRYHHIFNPHTGDCPQEWSSVSVLAPRCVDADALTKPLFILGLDAGRKLLTKVPHCDAMFVTKAGRIFSTAGFPKLQAAVTVR